MDDEGAEFRGTERFVPVARLGAGGMGVVYKAFDREQRTQVAVKTLLRFGPTELLRLKAEFRALADLRHPNWVRFGELFEVDGQWFFTMELVEGSDFLSYVRGAPSGHESRDSGRATEATRASPLLAAGAPTVVAHSMHDLALHTRPDGPPYDDARLRAAVGQLVRAVFALHVAGKIHRDVKPSNVLVTAAGRVVLLDFGLALDTQAIRRGAEHHVAGTVEYMAPEQVMDTPVGVEADWYSVGVVLYEALTGRLPHVGSALEVLAAKQHTVPPAPDTVRPALPADLVQLAVDLLRIAPSARPTGEEVLRRLAIDPAAEIGTAWRVESGRTGPLVGRAHALDVLLQAFAATRLGRAVAVVVAGESGVGKSALVQWFTERIQHTSASTEHGPSVIALPLRPPNTANTGGTRIPWADLMRHGFDLDVLVCPRCASPMHVVSVVQDRAQARRYLEHLGVPVRDDVPKRAWDPVPIDPLRPDGPDDPGDWAE